MSSNQDKDIILEQSLRTYFYKSLSDLNKKSLCPLPEETIYYSSEVLERYALSEEFFNYDEGKVKEKILGMELLKSSNYSETRKKEVLKDVGDTALVLTGYFAESIKSKITDDKYYVQIGKMAYQRVNEIYPSCYDIPSFYKIMASCFENLIALMTLLVQKHANDQLDYFSLSTDDNMAAHMGIHIPGSKKVS